MVFLSGECQIFMLLEGLSVNWSSKSQRLNSTAWTVLCASRTHQPTTNFENTCWLSFDALFGLSDPPAIWCLGHPTVMFSCLVSSLCHGANLSIYKGYHLFTIVFQTSTGILNQRCKQMHGKDGKWNNAPTEHLRLAASCGPWQPYKWHTRFLSSSSLLGTELLSRAVKSHVLQKVLAYQPLRVLSSTALFTVVHILHRFRHMTWHGMP